MAVPEQTPYIEHIGNGVITSFALKFQCESKDHLIVMVDEIEPPISSWSLTEGNVVFTTAPASGKKIKLQRNTPFGRTTNYQSFNNSFRPQTVNVDFDRIWWKLQELGVADWLMKLYVDRLHQQQEQKINDLKVYVDDRDDELRAYLLEEIRKQGVALDQLDDYYNYLMQRLAQVAIDRGWAASFIVSADGSTQQQVNDRIGNTWYAKPLGYELNARVMLTNGDIVKSTIPNNINDPNVDMIGWVKTNNASQISDKSGLTQQKINDLTVTPYHFGGIGDGLNHPLSERYTTLAQAQSIYPFAEALTDSLDYCALRAFFDFCQLNAVNNANVSFNAYVHKKLYLDGAFATKTYYGDLSLTNTQTVYEIDGLIQINVVDFKLFGKLTARGTTGDVKNRKQLAGVIIGDGGTDGSGGRTYIDTINCVGFRDFGLVMINDSIFPSFRYNFNSNIGSRGAGSTFANHSTTFRARTDFGGANYDQYSELTVDSLPPNTLGKYFKNPIMIKHDGELYTVLSINSEESKIRVYPYLNFKSTDTSINYIYGIACGWIGNNAGCGNFGTVQSILCGIGFWGTALYGATIDYAISEYCGVGFTTNERFNLSISYIVSNSYFEANQFNYVAQWGQGGYSRVKFGTSHAIDLSKCTDLYNYRSIIYEADTGGRRLKARFSSSSFYLDGEDYNVNRFGSYSSDITTSADFVFISTTTATQQLTIDINKAISLGIDKKLLIVAPHTEQLTLTPPSGWTFSSDSVPVLTPSLDHLLVHLTIDAGQKILTLKYAKQGGSATVYSAPSIPANSSVTTTVSLPGALVGDIVQASFSVYNPSIEVSASISAANTATVRFKNISAEPVSPISGTIRVKFV